MSAHDLEFAKEIYNAYHAQENWLGPVPSVPEANRTEAERIRNGIDEVVRTAASPRERCLRVNSPWHAALVLIHIQHQLLREKSHLIFRGQAVESWTISTSMERAMDKPHAIRARDAFCALLEKTWNAGPAGVEIPPAACVAIAQHYGLSTDLLDFTPDPSVAVHFANSPQHAGQMARVFILPLAVAKELGARVLLPPPFVRRLHAQLGIFLALDASAVIKDHLSEVEFPIDPGFGEFTIVRERESIDLLPQDPWLEHAKEWAQEWAARTAMEFPLEQKEVFPILDAAYAAIGYPPFMRNPFGYERQIAEWIDYFSQMLYWLVIVIDDSGESYDLDTLELIIKSNPSLMELAVAVFRALGEKERVHNPVLSDHRIMIAQVIEQILKRV